MSESATHRHTTCAFLPDTGLRLTLDLNGDRQVDGQFCRGAYYVTIDNGALATRIQPARHERDDRR